MKRVFLAALVVLAVSTAAFSDGLMFRQGINSINAGLNLNFGAYDGLRPGVLVAYDRGAINNMFSFGGEVGFYTDRNKVTDVEWNYNVISPLFRFGFHPFGIPAVDNKNFKAKEVIDPYVVVGAGFSISAWSHEISGDKERGSDFDFAWALKPGIRFYFNQRVNLWAEGWWDGLTIGAGLNF